MSSPFTGLMQRRDASINDVRIKESDRRYIRNPKTGLVEFPQGHPSDK
jgi:nuclear transport factor 2 (NTF2) superfamily protein